MAYQTGFLRERVTIKNKVADAAFGDTTDYAVVATVWASATFQKGMRALREGALDAYDTMMFRMRYNDFVNRDSRLVYDGAEYQITSIHRDMHENILQIIANEIE